ncbi:VIT1/CCC1 transporter family protein [Candidatus Dojkabacteria bacterium]|uniref:VIT1/CCC1 transporter family protein n=1 Tax=Candidatus Dojkabacteria bacterium TaxID=2099670 RepID=A0A955L3B7_9BACT|nr:VIT1/CCC1 transporter family protein [Candidatus Dojkabacteria bacterium]
MNKVSNAISEYIPEIVYGASDGIVTTFAVVAGYSGARLTGDSFQSLTVLTVLLFGFANLFADGVSMALGNYLSNLSQKDKVEKVTFDIEAEEKKKHHKEVSNKFLLEKGFSETESKELTAKIESNKDFWPEWILFTKGISTEVISKKPSRSSAMTFLSFVIFGLIPLLPFLILETNNENALLYSFTGTLIALIILGFVRWKAIGDSAFHAIGQIVLIGTISAFTAFLVGSLIGSV